MPEQEMHPVVVLFPYTVLPMSTLGALAPLFRVIVLAPASLKDTGLGAVVDSGLVEVRRPPLPAPEAYQEAVRLVRQWEQWVREHAGSELKELLKAGVEPPEPETFRTLMREIRGQQRREKATGAPSRMEAEVFLHLVHIYDQQAAELEGILARAEQRRRALEEMLREHEELAGPPPEYEEHELERIPPVEYSFDLPQLAPRRLAAWGVLAMACGPLPRLFATTSTEAVEVMEERLMPPGAGLVPGKGAMVELGEVAFAELGRLQGLGEGLESVRGRMTKVLGELEEIEQPGEWFGEFKGLLEEYRALVGREVGQVGLRRAKVFWLPGMDPQALTKVMAGQQRVRGQGSCVVVLVSQGGAQ